MELKIQIEGNKDDLSGAVFVWASGFDSFSAVFTDTTV
jgi:hypothetical protein